MAKISTRCKWYDDRGKGNGKDGSGCFKSDCRFVHPTDPEWDKLEPSRRTNKDRGRNEWDRGRNDKDRRDSWGPPPKSAGSEWNMAAMDAPTLTSTNNTILSETGKKWGAPSGSKDQTEQSANGGAGFSVGASTTWNFSSDLATPKVDVAAKAESSTSWNLPTSTGWGALAENGTGWGKTDGGWGSATNDQSGGGWGVPVKDQDGGGWGSAAKDQGDGGWGSVANVKSSGGWGGVAKDKSNGSVWGDSGDGKNSGNVWGSGGGQDSGQSKRDTGSWGGGGSWGTGDDGGTKNDKGKGKGKERPTEDFKMRDAPPLSASAMVNPFSSAADVQKSTGLPRATPNAPPHHRELLETTAPAPVGARPSVSTSGRTHAPPLLSLKEQVLELKLTKAQQVEAAKQYQGPKGRVALYNSVLKHMQNAAMLQIELQRALSDQDRWKMTQASEIHSRSTQKTRKMLDTQRLSYKQRVEEVKKELQGELLSLVNLPDFGNQHTSPDSVLAKDTIVAYTQELKSWFEDLQIHKRLLLEKAGSPISEVPETQSTTATTIEEVVPKVRITPMQLIQQGKWSWRELKEAAEDLDARISAASEEVYADAFTNVQGDMAETIDELGSQYVLDGQVQQMQRVQHEDIPSVSRGIDAVGDRLAVQAKQVGELVEKADRLQKELDSLAQEKAKFDELATQAERSFGEFEQWKLSDMARIEELTKQLQTLYLHKRPSSANSTPQPVKIDDLHDYIRSKIVEVIQTELAPVFLELRTRCSESQDQLKSEFMEEVEAISIKSDQLRKRVQAKASLQ